MPERAPFAPQNTMPAPAVGDRRVSVRRLCGKEALSRPDVVPENIVWEGIVHDLATDGVGVWITSPFPPGTTLAIELLHRENARPLQAEVVHTTPQGNGWLHGCALVDKLSNDELQALL